MKNRFLKYSIVILFFLLSSCTTTSQLSENLLSNGYNIVQGKYSTAEEYQSQMFLKDKNFFPFEYVKTKEKRGYSITYIYRFYNYSKEMVNKYVEVLIIHDSGEKEYFEKENVNNERGKKILKWKGYVGDAQKGTGVQNPVLYLWE